MGRVARGAAALFILLMHQGYLGMKLRTGLLLGAAFTAGKPDHGVNRDAMLEHVAAIAAAVDLPVSGDLENGYGDLPEEAAQTILLAASAGLVGGSIEDSTNRVGDPIYEIGAAAERVQAAAEAAHGLSFPFTLTARAENYLHGCEDLADTIKRLQAYQQAGADVLYAPGLVRKQDIQSVVSSVDRPVNVLAGLGDVPLDLAALTALGVKRISVGGALARVALGAFLRAAQEMRDNGKFTFANDAASGQELNRIFASRPVE